MSMGKKLCESLGGKWQKDTCKNTGRRSLAIAVILIFVGVVAVGLIGHEEGMDISESLANGVAKIINPSAGGAGGGGGGGDSTTTTTTTTTTSTTPTPTWVPVASGSGWSFVGSGDYKEWTLDLGSIRIGTGEGTPIRVDITRRWNFKTGFSGGDYNLVWCLHDSTDSQIWHVSDTDIILAPGRTDTITTGMVYDGRPWRMFIGNNFSNEVDCYWWLNIYAYE